MDELKPSREDTIILNVGGIKYETYPSTLTAHPDTLLGTMFSEPNKSKLHPKNGNEYFIDRNGYAFRYILEFYRNGKIPWSDDPGKNNVTREEFEREIDYFQIPTRDCTRLSGERTISAKIDAFVTALKKLIIVAMDQFQTEIHLAFFEDGSSGTQHCIPATNKCEVIFEAIRPFDTVGFAILRQFGEIIKRHLKSEIPEITCELSDKVSSAVIGVTQPPFGNNMFSATSQPNPAFGFSQPNTAFGNVSQGSGLFNNFGATASKLNISPSRRLRNNNPEGLELIITINYYGYTVEQILRNTVLAKA